MICPSTTNLSEYTRNMTHPCVNGFLHARKSKIPWHDHSRDEIYKKVKYIWTKLIDYSCNKRDHDYSRLIFFVRKLIRKDIWNIIGRGFEWQCFLAVVGVSLYYICMLRFFIHTRGTCTLHILSSNQRDGFGLRCRNFCIPRTIDLLLNEGKTNIH